MGLACIMLLLQGGVLLAAPPSIPESEALDPPDRARLATLLAAAAREGWAAQVPGLRAVAFRAYEQDRWLAAEAWDFTGRWAGMFGESEGAFVAHWVQAVEEARVVQRNMPPRYRSGSRPLAANVSPALQAWLLDNPAFSRDFFALLSPLDYLLRVLGILSELHLANPTRFQTYAGLALALAVVYDVLPPPDWPHGQVSAEALPRRLPPPVEAMDWWIRQDQSGRTYHKLARLGAEELKFVVDAAAPFAELEWSVAAVPHPLATLAATFTNAATRKLNLL